MYKIDTKVKNHENEKRKYYSILKNYSLYIVLQSDMKV